MSKLLELISDIQDYGYDITDEKKVSNKTLADYLEFYMANTENPECVFWNGQEKMRTDVLDMLKETRARVFPAHVKLVEELIEMVEKL
jgi:hypothetical protein